MKIYTLTAVLLLLFSAPFLAYPQPPQDVQPPSIDGDARDVAASEELWKRKGGGGGGGKGGGSSSGGKGGSGGDEGGSSRYVSPSSGV